MEKGTRVAFIYFVFMPKINYQRVVDKFDQLTPNLGKDERSASLLVETTSIQNNY